MIDFKKLNPMQEMFLDQIVRIGRGLDPAFNHGPAGNVAALTNEFDKAGEPKKGTHEKEITES